MIGPVLKGTRSSALRGGGRRESSLRGPETHRELSAVLKPALGVCGERPARAQFALRGGEWGGEVGGKWG